MTECIRVLIAEDHALVRTALGCLLAQETWINVVGEAASGHETISQVERLQPDVLLLDLMMPGKRGLAVLHELRHLAAPTRAIVLTACEDDDVMMAAFSAGAEGFLPKSAPPEELLALIRSVHNNQPSINPVVARRFVRKVQHNNYVSSLIEKLTLRERQVMLLVANGLSDADIARKLSVSTRTIRNHVSQVAAKLALANRTEIALFALRNGLVRLNEVELKPTLSRGERRRSRTPGPTHRT